MKPAAFSKTALKRLQRQLSDWRDRQIGRVRLPEAMWIAATKLARTQGIGLVARTLGLDYYKLRARVNGEGVPRIEASAFVELKSAALPGPSLEECKVGRRRKYYRLKKEGKRALKEQSEEWMMVHSVLSGLLKEQHV